jgi:tRNA threonylcarbamoyladenosine biosynthesis protein TsaB
MKILAFDTATAACSVALLIGEEIHEQVAIAPQRHAELILPMIETLLNEAGISLAQLNAIAFGHGPGSFMGVRIATGVAQGLAFGADLPVIPVSTLQALAQTAWQQNGCPDIIAAWDARMQAIYWGVYSLSESGLMLPSRSDALNPPEELLIPTGKNWLLAGNAWKIYHQQLASKLNPDAQIVDIYPQARAILSIAQVSLREGKVHSALEVEPVYLRNEVTHLNRVQEKS